MRYELMTYAGVLPKTRWSLVIRAGGLSDDPATREEARKSLEELCEAYWPALYAYLRRQGYQRSDAEDLIQGFFTDLLARQSIETVDQQKGRFRAFLFSSLDHFVSNQMRSKQAIKRGGGTQSFSLHAGSISRCEEALELDPEGPNVDPAKCFDRQWAICLLQNTLAELASFYEKKGKEDLIRELSPFLTADVPDASARKEIATRLGMTATALKVAIHRLRADYRERLMKALAATIDDPSEWLRERQWLFEVLGAH
ncbi:MAG: sigma factor [Planctomycetota bacterium]